MPRSNSFTLLTLLLILVFCPQPNEAKAEDNTIAVESVTISEDKTARIAFQVEVKDATIAVEFDVDKITDTKALQESLHVKDDHGQPVLYSPAVESKKLKLTLAQGIYQVQFQDPRIIVSSPKYAVKLIHDTSNNQLTGTIEGTIEIENGSTYAWPKEKEIRYVKKDSSTSLIVKLSMDFASGEKIHVPLNSYSIPAQSPGYQIAITELTTGQAHPDMLMDLKQPWSQTAAPFQIPGSIQFTVNGTVGTSVEEKTFKDTIASASQSVGKRDSLTVTRTETPKAYITLDNTEKHLLKGTFKTDYIYQYTTAAGPDIDFLISTSPAQKVTLATQTPTLRLTHSTDLTEVVLLVNTENPLVSLAADLKAVQKEVATRKEAGIKELKPGDLASKFPKANQDKITYTPSSQAVFDNNLKQSLAANQKLVKRLTAIDYYADIISKIFATIPTETDYQQTIRRLAASGAHDAEVTLLRKQRSEQINYAKNFLQVYHALVLESADGFPVRIEIIQVNTQPSSRVRIVGPRGVTAKTKP